MKKTNYYINWNNLLNVAKRGGMFILVDDEKRENEGDLVISTSDYNMPRILILWLSLVEALICLALDSLTSKKD